MRAYGFSTGAVAKGDFRRALTLLEELPVTALELSALRVHEVEPLSKAVDGLNLERYAFVSVHAPSKYAASAEPEVVRQMSAFSRRGMHIVVHPDAIVDAPLWSNLATSLCIENMDKRKPIGRTAAELDRFFSMFPDAGFCLDIGHARQVDPTMSETRLLLRTYGSRLREIHLSELTTGSKHERLSMATVDAVAPIASLVAPDVPVIIESEIDASDLAGELSMAKTVFGDATWPRAKLVS
jgi:hypothetical protein